MVNNVSHISLLTGQAYYRTGNTSLFEWRFGPQTNQRPQTNRNLGGPHASFLPRLDDLGLAGVEVNAPMCVIGGQFVAGL